VEDRLNGNIKQLDDTVLPIYDAIPRSFRGWNFIEIFDLMVERMDEGLYSVELTLNLFSDYSGYKEVHSIAQQVNDYLASQLRDMASFTDVSEGGSLVSSRSQKMESDDGKVIRLVEYKRRWSIADNQY